MTGRHVGRYSYLNFFHSSATRYGSRNASVVLKPLGQLQVRTKHKATCPCPILPLYLQEIDSHKGERGGSGAFWQSSAPQRLEELIGFAYEDHSAEIQPTTASKFHKFLFSLKNSLISWEDSLACNVERKVILPAEAWFVYNVLERLLFVFSAAENSSGCCRQRPGRNRRREVCSNAGC